MTRTLGDVSLDGHALRFECFSCHRRSAILAHKVGGWPEKALSEIRSRLACAKCGSQACEIAEVVWCEEMEALAPKREEQAA